MKKTSIIDDLQKVIATETDPTLLMGDSAVLNPLQQQLGHSCLPYSYQALPLPKNCKYKQAVIWQPSQCMDHKDSNHLLAKLRDQVCATVYVCEQIKTHNIYTAEIYHHLQKLGFLLLDWYDDKNALFYFDICDYKQVPEWLNNRFWANPERWNKERW